jgi:hypothetical protein
VPVNACSAIFSIYFDNRHHHHHHHHQYYHCACMRSYLLVDNVRLQTRCSLRVVTKSTPCWTRQIHAGPIAGMVLSTYTTRRWFDDDDDDQIYCYAKLLIYHYHYAQFLLPCPDGACTAHCRPRGPRDATLPTPCCTCQARKAQTTMGMAINIYTAPRLPGPMLYLHCIPWFLSLVS